MQKQPPFLSVYYSVIACALFFNQKKFFAAIIHKSYCRYLLFDAATLSLSMDYSISLGTFVTKFSNHHFLQDILDSCHVTQKAQANLNKDFKHHQQNLHWVCFKDFKTVSHEILATRVWKGRGRQHSQFCPILANGPKLAMLASTALPCPSCQDFIQYIFGILEAH